MRHHAFPYRRPSFEVVQAEKWIVSIGDEELPLPEAYPNWDYQTDLKLRRTVKVDVERALAETTLAPDTPLALSVVWTSTGSKLRGTAVREIVPRSGELEIVAQLSGAELGGTVTLETALVLPRRRSGRDRPVAPRRGGSVLWRDFDQIRLQGDAAQFPVAIVDFDKTNYPAGASWHLEIGSDPHSATMGSLLLLVNEKKPTVVEAVQRAASPRLQDRVTLSVLYADVARLMVHHALTLGEFDDEIEFEDETIGATLQELFERLFPGRGIADVRLTATKSPTLFSSELQAAAKMFEGFR